METPPGVQTANIGPLLPPASSFSAPLALGLSLGLVARVGAALGLGGVATRAESARVGGGGVPCVSDARLLAPGLLGRLGEQAAAAPEEGRGGGGNPPMVREDLLLAPGLGGSELVKALGSGGGARILALRLACEEG